MYLNYLEKFYVLAACIIPNDIQALLNRSSETCQKLFIEVLFGKHLLFRIQNSHNEWPHHASLWPKLLPKKEQIFTIQSYYWFNYLPSETKIITDTGYILHDLCLCNMILRQYDIPNHKGPKMMWCVLWNHPTSIALSSLHYELQTNL